jgi:hypothetical protein
MAQDPRQAQAKRWGQVVARAWSDDTFKQRLLSDPKAVLAEAGLPVPPTMQIRMHEATPTLLHLVLPPRPPLERLSAEELAAVAGGQDVTATSAKLGIDQGKLEVGKGSAKTYSG